MECPEVLKTREAAILRLSGELPPEAADRLDDHLACCAACAEEERRLAAAWEGLEDGRDVQPSPEFLDRTEALLLAEVARRRVPPPSPVVPLRPSARRFVRPMLQAAALLLAVSAGFLVARMTADVTRPAGSGVPRFPVVARRTLDVSEALPDLSNRPRLNNVAFRPADSSGRIGVSFDVTTRYTVTGRPNQKGIADLLVYLVSGAADTEGAKGQAIELVSLSSKGTASAPPEVVAALAETARNDRNPGVRKKAVEALTQLPPSEAVRDALIAALKNDANPAVRILAVEGLAKVGSALRDRTTLDALRARAVDERENGYVRVQAAQALSKLEL